MWKLVLALALSRAAHALRPAPPTMVARPVRVGDTLHVTVREGQGHKLWKKRRRTHSPVLVPVGPEVSAASAEAAASREMWLRVSPEQAKNLSPGARVRCVVEEALSAADAAADDDDALTADDVLSDLRAVCRYRFGLYHTTFQVSSDEGLFV